MNTNEHIGFKINSGKVINHYGDKTVSTHALFVHNQKNGKDTSDFYCSLRKSWSRSIRKTISGRVIASFYPIQQDSSLVAIDLYGSASVVGEETIYPMVDHFESYHPGLFYALARSVRDFINKYDFYKIELDESVRHFSFNNDLISLTPQSILCTRTPCPERAVD